MLRQVIFATAPHRKNSWEFLRHRAGSGSYGTPGVLVLLLQKNCLPRIGANDFKSVAFSKKAAQWCSGDTLHRDIKGIALKKRKRCSV